MSFFTAAADGKDGDIYAENATITRIGNGAI
jgi:hypothetical protein